MNRKKDCSVALSYLWGEEAPIITASGRGAVAQKIREIADAHRIPLVCDPGLAEVLIEADIGSCIRLIIAEAIIIQPSLNVFILTLILKRNEGGIIVALPVLSIHTEHTITPTEMGGYIMSACSFSFLML